MKVKKQPPSKVRPKKGNEKHPHPGAVPAQAALQAAAHAAKESVEALNSTGAALRWRAGVYYVTDVNRCSVADLLEMPDFRGVSLSEMTEWSKTDGWVAQRAKFLEQLKQKMQYAVIDSIVDRRMRMVEAVSEVTDKIFRKFTPHKYVPIKDPDDDDVADLKQKKGKPKRTRCALCGRFEVGHDDLFWGEGGATLVKSLREVVNLENDLLSVTLQQVKAQLPEQTTPGTGAESLPEGASQLTADEAFIAAQAVLRHRRVAMEPVIDVEPTPAKK